MSEGPDDVLQVLRLGRVEYEDGLQLQKLTAQARLDKRVPDTLLLLEHPPVLTLGRAAKDHNILASPDDLARKGVEVFETDRGGDVTYHGPGQIVGYPIFHLEGARRDVRRYVRDVEECMIRALAEFGITAGRIEKWTGVWVEPQSPFRARKIGAIGVHISRWLTTHGFALNVQPDLSHFQLIVPCGIREAGVTSLAQELGKPVDASAVELTLAKAYGEIFDKPVQLVEGRTESVSVAVLRERKAGPEVLLLHRTAERGGFWQLVTGRCEPGESPEQAARRELEEETGGAPDLMDLGYQHSFALGDALPARIFHETAWAARWPEAAEVKLSAEHQELAWLPVEAALNRLPFAGLRRAVRMAVERLERRV